MSLPTKGRVLIVTSVGDIEIELWANVRVQLMPFCYGSDISVGNAQSMQKLHRTRSRGYDICSRPRYDKKVISG